MKIFTVLGLLFISSSAFAVPCPNMTGRYAFGKGSFIMNVATRIENGVTVYKYMKAWDYIADGKPHRIDSMTIGTVSQKNVDYVRLCTLTGYITKESLDEYVSGVFTRSIVRTVDTVFNPKTGDLILNGTGTVTFPNHTKKDYIASEQVKRVQ